jgi:hypothetical protein
VAGAAVKQTPIADQDIDGGCACRPFSHNDKQFEWGQKLTRDEVLAIPLACRRMRVETGDLKIYKRRRQQHHANVGAALVLEKLPPWNGRAPTERENDEMRAWIEKTFAALIEHDGQAAYQDSMRALGQLSRWSPQARHDLYAKWMADYRMREWRYGNREPLLKALRKRVPGVEEWAIEPPGKQGQPRRQREHDMYNSRLLSALKYVDRIRNCFPPGGWPRAMVVEIVAAHYGLGIEEVEKARHRGAKEVEKTLRHLTR